MNPTDFVTIQTALLQSQIDTLALEIGLSKLGHKFKITISAEYQNPVTGDYSQNLSQLFTTENFIEAGVKTHVATRILNYVLGKYFNQTEFESSSTVDTFYKRITATQLSRTPKIGRHTYSELNRFLLHYGYQEL